MSAPDTNLKTQTRRHWVPLFIGCLGLAAVVLVGYLAWVGGVVYHSKPIRNGARTNDETGQTIPPSKPPHVAPQPSLTGNNGTQGIGKPASP